MDQIFARLGMTRNQAVMIGALVAVLVGAIIYGQSGTKPAEGEAAAAVPAPAAPEAVPPQRESASTIVGTTRWPVVSLDRMLQHNPFKHIDLPTEPVVEEEPESPPAETPTAPTADAVAADLAVLKAERQKRVQEMLDELRDQKVQLILRSGDKVSAMIGTRLVHEGDLIDGVRIVSILPNGVIVEPEDVID